MAEITPELTPLQKAALAVKALRSRVDELERAAGAPIAVIGIGCRYPAAGDGPQGFWDAIRGGRDGSIEIPRERWDVDSVYDPTPVTPGKMYVRKSCFIDGVDRFDPLFFRISPREAIGIDPQQRLLLETAWEALEDAAIPPPSLVGSRTGVFLGISTNDYSALLSRTAHGSGSNATAGAGNAASVASGRISYTFGFQGPCLAVDTACSSSLVAAHLAVQALRNGECGLALVAGVNLMLSPEITINFSQGRMLSPDGHCKTFDSGADGYVRGEGCGVLVLKRLSDALAAGDRIHAVIRGSAVNQDGRSAGLTAPNGLAQEAVIRQALANARMEPSAVDYIEAHGTGTPLGDPIEMHALKAVFGPGRDRPLYVGSVKTNIGHAEAASGVAGLIKAVLMLRHQAMPPHLHFKQLNPHIDLSGIDIRIPRENVAMPLAVAGVSSFGFSGTNAHVVLSAPPAPVPRPESVSTEAPQLFLSARSRNALQRMIEKYDAMLSEGLVGFADVCHTAAVGRARFPWWVMVEHADELSTAVPSNAPPPTLRPTSGRKVSLPTYPFERERYWIDAEPVVAPAEKGVRLLFDPKSNLTPFSNPLLGRKLRLPFSTETRWESVIGSSVPGLEFLDQHHVGSEAVMPAACFIEMALAAHPGREIVEMRIPGPLTVPVEPKRALQTIGQSDGNFRIVSFLLDGSEDAVTHAIGRVAAPQSPSAVPPPAQGDGVPLPVAALYVAMERRGVRHGPAFRLLQDVKRWNGSATATLREGPQWPGLHPATLDAALQLVGAALPDMGHDVLLPARFGQVRGMRRPGAGATVRAIARPEGDAVNATIVIEDAQGVAFHIADMRFERSRREVRAPQVSAPAVTPVSAIEVTQILAPEVTPVSAIEVTQVLAPEVIPASAIEVTQVLAPEAIPASAIEVTQILALEVTQILAPEVTQILAPETRVPESTVREEEGGDGLYRLEWQPKPLVEGIAPPRFFPQVTDLSKTLASESERLGALHGMAAYAAAGEALERVATGYVLRALRELGMVFVPGAQFTVGPLAESLRIDERHHRLFGRMLEMLVQDGVLERRGRVLQVARDPAAIDSDEAIAALARQFPAMAGEIGMVRRCGTALAQVLEGDADPLALLFPADDKGAGVFYDSSAYARTVNGLLQAAVEKLAATLPPGRALRVLEVGAGTGGATRAVLAGLANVPFTYAFTDVSPAFLGEAKKAFPDPRLKTRLLDIERDPAGQGYAGERFDLVVAANVLHATRDLRESLSHVAGLLADDGMLMLVESTEPRRWVDIVFGLTGGWWRFEDTKLRASHPLISRGQWRETLAANGFDAGEDVATEVIVARKDASASPALSPSPALPQGGGRILPWVVNVPAANDQPQTQAMLLRGLVMIVKQAIARQPATRLVLCGSSALGHGGLPGFVRALALEHPALEPRLLIDVPGPDCLADEVASASTEPEVRWVKGVREVMRIAPCAAQEFATAKVTGAWLITGGYGGLGIEIARWLAARGATRLVLLGRHRPAKVPDLGVPLMAHEGDAADEALVSRIVTEMSDLQGVVHAAGALADAPIVEQTPATMEAVLRPKVAGAIALDRATRGRTLEHFVLFASAAGVVGSANQANHAFCSTFLDALAHSRRAQGLPGLSLDWGVWSEVGAAARQGFDAQAVQLGLGAITPRQGVSAFGTALSMTEAQLMVLPSVDWTRFIGHMGEHASPLYEGVRPVAEPEPAPAAAIAPQGDAAETLAAIVGELLRLPKDFDRTVPLAELGLDSLVAVEIKNQVLRKTGADISVRELIEGASIVDLARRLERAAPQEPAAPQAALVPDTAHRHEPFPLTEMQQAFWVGRRSDLALGDVNCYLYTEFDAERVDIPRLESAWNTLVRRHDMLRVVIQSDGKQRILADVPEYRLEILDLRDRPEGEVQGELALRRAALADRVSGPDTWPLFDIRITLFGDKARIHLGFDLIAMDAASIFAVRHELGALYDNPATVLAPIGISFRDYVLHLESSRDSAEWRRSEEYWKARAKALPGAPDLPLLPPAARARPVFKRHRVRIDPSSAEALRAGAQARGLTLPSVLAAAYAHVLALWSRSANFCVTVTLFNRPPLHPDMGSLIGDFTSTILLEVDARAGTFAQRAQALMARLAEDLDHGAVSGIHVLREVARQNGQGLRTIPVVFTSALGFRRPASGDAGMWDRLGTTVYSVSSTPQVWIDHQISEEDGNLFCHWDVLEGVFPPGVVDGMLTAYRALVDALVAGAGWDRSLAAARLGCATRPSIAAAPPGECLHAAFEREATRHPRRTALIAPDALLDYGTLQLASSHLALKLAARLGGVEAARDRLVAVCFAKGWRQIVSVFAVLKAGAAYLPVDPALPAERRALLIEQGEALVLDDAALLDEALRLARAGFPAPALPEVADASRLAYVIYTSGSTGMPKGVMMEHAAAHCTVHEVNRRWSVGREDRVLGLSSLSFDLSVYDIFGVLGTGGVLVLPEPEAARDPTRWSQLIAQHRVTVWNTVPALMAMQIEHGVPATHSLRLVMLSGDWVPLELVAKLKAVAPKARLVALGGATEAGIWSNAHEIEALDPDWPSIPYGLPLAGQQLHIADGRGDDAPDWAIGNIEISGRALARGYWRDAAKTADRFRVDASGERRYVTGDLGRFRPYATAPAGSATPIEFLGREDTQVKIQGHRVELGEIEAALVAHPQVAAAAVVAAGATAKSLHAVIVPRVDGDAGWQAFVAQGKEAAYQHAEPVDTADFDAVARVSSAHAIGAAAEALRTLAIEKGEVAPRYQHWLRRMKPLVAAFRPDDAPVSLEGIAKVDLFGFGADDFGLLEAVARNLPDILTERLHSSDIYLSKQTPEVYAKLFARPNAIVAKLVAARAKEKPISVLEVGGGLGTTLAAIAPALPAGRVAYHFTDLSPHMVERAREAFAKIPGLTFGTLDFDREPPADTPRYDVIVATSALHAAADVRRTLAHLATMLAPGGVLVAFEQTRFFPWFDLNMGLQAGFDTRTDRDLRPDHPLLSREAWCRLLAEAGFADSRALVAEGSVGDRLGVDVIVARAPDAAPDGGAVRLGDAGVLSEPLASWLQERLPVHMLPKTIDAIDRLPLSSNGKVDRARIVQALQRRTTGDRPPSDNPAEREVAALVGELLPGAPGDPERSLFELGATSLTLVALHRLIAERLGRNIALQAMFETPTIASFARALAAARDVGTATIRTTARPTRPANAFVTLEARNDERPVLAMVPGVLALPYYLRGLASALAPDVTLAALQLPGLFGEERPLDSVEAQADYAVRHLREFQPEGPYLIAGHSYGGYVAIEMARRLRTAGESVPLLVVGDSVRTYSTLEAFQTDDIAYVAMARALYALYGAQLSRPYEDVKALGPRACYETVGEEIERLGLLGAALPLEKMTAMFKANFRALGAYRPAPIPGDMVVVRTEGGFPPEFLDYETGDALADAALGWTGMVKGRLDVRVMPGDHLSMQDAANTKVFADILRGLVVAKRATAGTAGD